MAEKEKYSHDEELKKILNDFFAEIKDHLLTNYEPTEKWETRTITLTTKEIFDGLHKLFPSSLYNQADVVLFLRSAGFKFMETGTLRFEWMLNKKTP